MELELTYYRRRMAEENAAAEAASRAEVRAVHLQLAAAYDRRIAELKIDSAPSEIAVVPFS